MKRTFLLIFRVLAGIVPGGLCAGAPSTARLPCAQGFSYLPVFDFDVIRLNRNLCAGIHAARSWPRRCFVYAHIKSI